MYWYYADEFTVRDTELARKMKKKWKDFERIMNEVCTFSFKIHFNITYDKVYGGAYIFEIFTTTTRFLTAPYDLQGLDSLWNMIAQSKEYVKKFDKA